jgi:hypothetical protein
MIIATTDGGATWSSQSSGVGDDLLGISCPTTSTCWAVGSNGRMLATGDGGATWSSRASGGSELRGITCPTTSTCRVVGFNGRILATSDGGASWSSQSSGTSDNLHAVACPTATSCWVVGDEGRILATTNGGATWAAQGSGTTELLAGVSCTTTTLCWAVGANGVILRYDASSPGAYPSNDCDGGGTIVFDGFVERAYYKLRTRPNPTDPTETWICVAVDTTGTHFGGKVAVSQSAVGAVSVDDAVSECDANTSTRIFEQEGAVGPVPFDVDVNRFASGDIWVCVMANATTVEKRVKVSTSSLPGVNVALDDSAPYPYVEPPTPGSASVACQTGGGNRTRIVNARVGTSHVWLYTWTEANFFGVPTRMHVCTRAQTPLMTTGGRLTIDAGGGQTLATVDESSDFGPCETNLLTLSTPPLVSRIHAGTPPAWVCLRADTIYRRVKLDPAGGQGIATFRPDM